ncbi:hypothetical protein E5843_14660 [Luteimonas yindakuii]|uniref:hypothetical protein n=1 Tax=Luteimonas yindakuii TaxID=2565782 RepID=UPI00110775BE|nr:hypothetical protein [Luteimonas yindakuii]QCU72768.1 hypothetical protein E5843_14660 [Luteimonas yindakuii]
MRIQTLLLAAMCAIAGLTACSGDRDDGDTAGRGAQRPVDAVLLPAQHLREDDLVAFVRASVPAPLHAELRLAWSEGRSRWPLEELPLHDQLPRMIAALSAPDAETTLLAAFDKQFTGADGELRKAVETLAAFGVQYVTNDPDLDDIQRDREIQRLVALSRWAVQAPLTDPQRAQAALARLCAAARATGLESDQALREVGMDESLRRLSAFLATAKAVLADYGLDLDASLAALDVALERQTGDHARLRVRYPLADEAIDVRVEIERHDRHWYRSDRLRRATAAAGRDAGPAGPR